jgi:hypothetical protein
MKSKGPIRPFVLWGVAAILGVAVGLQLRGRSGPSINSEFAKKHGFESGEEMTALSNIVERGCTGKLSSGERQLVEKYLRKPGVPQTMVLAVLTEPCDASSAKELLPLVGSVWPVVKPEERRTIIEEWTRLVPTESELLPK